MPVKLVISLANKCYPLSFGYLVPHMCTFTLLRNIMLKSSLSICNLDFLTLECRICISMCLYTLVWSKLIISNSLCELMNLHELSFLSIFYAWTSCWVQMDSYHALVGPKAQHRVQIQPNPNSDWRSRRRKLNIEEMGQRPHKYNWAQGQDFPGPVSYPFSSFIHMY